MEIRLFLEIYSQTDKTIISGYIKENVSSRALQSHRTRFIIKGWCWNEQIIHKLFALWKDGVEHKDLGRDFYFKATSKTTLWQVFLFDIFSLCESSLRWSFSDLPSTANQTLKLHEKKRREDKRLLFKGPLTILVMNIDCGVYDCLDVLVAEVYYTGIGPEYTIICMGIALITLIENKFLPLGFKKGWHDITV